MILGCFGPSNPHTFAWYRWFDVFLLYGKRVFPPSGLVPGHENRLENFVYRVMSCNEMTALLRTCTLFKLAIFEPMRWLTGKAGVMEDWSIVNSSGVLNDLEKALVAIAADGHTLLDPSLDPFAEIANKRNLRSRCGE